MVCLLQYYHTTHEKDKHVIATVIMMVTNFNQNHMRTTCLLVVGPRHNIFLHTMDSSMLVTLNNVFHKNSDMITRNDSIHKDCHCLFFVYWHSSYMHSQYKNQQVDAVIKICKTSVQIVDQFINKCFSVACILLCANFWPIFLFN